ncbi:MAG: TatD family hydrolase [Candidatus Levybacteria bacterium]|nr:TatD family hydrolase [Candidatus Levybacteria bacterium]
MVDVHCHLNFHSFEKDYDEVIKHASKNGVKKIINVGTKIDSSQEAVELAKKYENLHAIVGVHPHHADKLERNWILELEKLTKNPKIVGIGECGMDFYRYKSNDIVDPSLQKEVFIKQIELAYKLKLPLQIHNRHAGKEIIEILTHHKSSLLNTPGMFHCMSGNIELLKGVLELGFYIGFDGNITYKGIAPGEDTFLPDLVKYTPLDRIVTETDSPFLTPEPYRGRRNVPSYVIIVGESIAKIKNASFAEVNKITTENAMNLFKLNAMP